MNSRLPAIGYVYAFQVGTYESHYYYSKTPDREKAVARAERWVRLFWPRFVAKLAAKHPGSIAHAICADGTELVVYEHRTSYAQTIQAGPWTRIHERPMPRIPRP